MESALIPTPETCPPDKIEFNSFTSEYVCTESGLILGDRIVFPIMENPPVRASLHDYGLSTKISRSQSQPSGAVKFLKRANWYGREFKIIIMFRMLHELADLVNAPNLVRDEASRIIRSAIEKNVKMRRRELVIAALYIAYKNLYNVSLYDFAKKLQIDSWKLLRRVLDLKTRLGIQVRTVPEDYRTSILKIVNAINIPPDKKGELAKKSIEIYEKVRPYLGNTTRVLASGVVAYVSRKMDLGITAEMITRVTGVSPDMIYSTKRRIQTLSSKLGNVLL